MDSQKLRELLFQFTSHELEYQKGKQDFSDLPFTYRKINHEQIPFIPLAKTADYRRGPFLSVRKHSRFQQFPTHCHEGIEINYMYSGSCQQIINGTPYTLQQGQTIFLNSNTVHQILPLKETDILLNINLNPDFLISHFLNRFSQDSILTRFFINALTDSIQQDTFLFFPSEKSESLRVYLENLLWEWYHPSIVSQDIMENLLSLIICELVIVYENHFADKTSSSDSLKVMPIIRYIEENYQTCTLTQIAQHFNLNPNYLSNLLKKHTGYSYRQLLQRQKLTVAEQLLRSSTLSISEITHLIGYENISFFYKKFQEKNHCLPNEYRQKALGKI